VGDVHVVADHLAGSLTDVTFEMLDQARKLAGDLGGSVVAVLIGGTEAMVSELGAASRVITVSAEGDFNPEIYSRALRTVVEARSPQVVMVGNTSAGMDLAGALSAGLKLPMAAYCSRVEKGGTITATSQLYGGKMDVVTDLGNGPCVVAMLAGSGSAEAGRVSGSPSVESVDLPAGAGKVRFKRLIQPEAADVDITTQEVLVAIGRGIGSKDDVEVAVELADALGAAVAASRPLVDAGWLPKSRQVGKSGVKVKPKVYLALGISGAPEHIEGMKSSATIIAVNTDENAPIFDVAHYGMVADLFDVCEELMELVE